MVLLATADLRRSHTPFKWPSSLTSSYRSYSLTRLGYTTLSAAMWPERQYSMFLTCRSIGRIMVSCVTISSSLAGSLVTTGAFSCGFIWRVSIVECGGIGFTNDLGDGG